MYQVSANFNNYAFAQAREVSLKYLINDSVNATNTDIIDFSLEQVFTDGQSATLGHSLSATMSARIRDVGVSWNGAKIKAWIGLTNPSDVVEWCPMGVFYVSSYETVDDFGTAQITAYDAMAFLDIAYTPTITLPATLSAVVADICTITGLQLEPTTFPSRNIDYIYDNGGNVVVQTIRDTLAYVAGLMGANAVISRDGKLEFRKMITQSVTITKDVQYLSEFKRQQNSAYTFSSLISGTEENQIVSGAGHAMSFTNPFMTQAILDSIRASVLPISVMTGEIKYRCDPQLDVGDIVSVTDIGGTSWNYLITGNKITVSGGMSATISCDGLTEEQATLTQVSNNALKNLIREQATVAVKYISADNITAGTIGADVIYGGTISANNITAGTLGADIIYGGTVDADHINAGTLSSGVIYSGNISASQITSGTIDASVIGVTNLDATNITTGYLSGSVIQAGTITASMLDTAYADIDLANVVLTSGEAIVTNTGYINTATITDLTTSNLRIHGKDGLYYMINVEGGAVSAVVADADLATYGQTIIDGTVTADKIYVSDLYALNATIGGLKIASGSIYSGTKTSLDTGIGLYMDSTGQLGLVGANGYLKFYDDNGSRKLSIVADSLFLGSTSVEDLEYNVEIQVTAIDYDLGTATLKAQPYKNGATQTASNFTYTWVKVKNGARTTLATTTHQLSVTDLDAIYEVVLQ